MSDALVIRAARADDAARIYEIMYTEPSTETVDLAMGVDAARRFGIGLLQLVGVTNERQPFVVAESNGLVVGMLQFSAGATPQAITFGQIKLALSVFGPIGVLRRLSRFRARAKVDVAIPPESFYIAELQVDPARRGGGIGGALLDWACDEAQRRAVSRLSLTTTTANPARRLYERKGFAVTSVAADPAFQRYTGIAGRVLMEKDLLRTP